MKKEKKFFRYFEFIFDLLYLSIALMLGIFLIRQSNDSLKTLSGFMALILVGGDSFHLIPRMIVILKGSNEKRRKMLGVGKLITSVTMTVFYVVLWHIGLVLFKKNINTNWTILVYILAIIRVVLCFFPQNKWLSSKSRVKWGIIRNIPFTLLGTAVAFLYFINVNLTLEFKYMWFAIVLSFLFYLPVVVWGQKKPVLGMLMLPKSCVYLWILFMFL